MMRSGATARVRTTADRVGVYASVLCVVHCLLTPVMISMSAVLAHLLPSEERTHRTLAMLVALAGAIALVKGFRTHGKRRVVLLMACGLACIGGGAFLGDRLPRHWMEVLVTFVGSTLMIAAHRMNHTFCRKCECAGEGGAC